jgi:GrpB-like predicted nucleotidyltransferase (UPF0157 family)
MLRVRDMLRDDPQLARAYEAEKRRLLSEGVLDGMDYAVRKSPFIKAVLAVPLAPGSPNQKWAVPGAP